MKCQKLMALFSTPLGLVTITGVLIAITELVIMLFVYDYLVPATVSETAFSYIDTSMLALIVAPALYFLVFRKMQQNITQHMLAEDEIRARENHIRALVDTIIDGIVVIDTKCCIQTINPAAVSLFGYELHEVQGQNVTILMPDSYASKHDSYVHSYLSTGIKKIIGIGREVIGKRQDGSTFPMELSVSEMEANGERMFIGIVRDITERKLAESAIIKAKDEAEEASRIKSEFISRMSHELKTPLNAVMGFSELIEMKMVIAGDTDTADMAHDVLTSGKQLLSLVNHVLDFSKITTGSLKIQLSQVNLLMNTIESIGSVLPFAEKRNIAIRLDNKLLDNLGDIRGDPIRLRQVLNNLLSNAIKFNKVGGEIEVTLETLSAEFTRLTVKDTGAGIAEEYIDELFHPFSQLQANNDYVAGAGVGLSITKAIVEKMGGRIGANSVKGQGTTLWIDMPTDIDSAGA